MKLYKTVSVFALVAVALAVIVLPLGTASSAGEQWLFTNVISTGCDNGQFGFEVAFVGLDAANTYTARTIVTDGIDIYTDEMYVGMPGDWSAFDTDWYMYDNNSGGTQTANYPLPADTTLTTTNTLMNEQDGWTWETVVNFVCNTGAWSVVSSQCIAGCGGGGAVEPVVEEPVPGCDVTIAIPSTAVGATMTADTAVYWAPGEASTETFPAGLTVRAIGVDASGAYTKVLYACGYYWVPTSVIGPNYDEVWNGAPLPTDVVD